MKKSQKISTLTLLLFLINILLPTPLSFALPANAEQAVNNESTPPAGSFVEGEIIVKFKPGTTEKEKDLFKKDHGLKSAKKLDIINSELIKTNNGDKVPGMLAKLKNNPLIETVQPNFIYKPDATVNDPSYRYMWNLNNTGQMSGGVPGIPDIDIDAPEAWDITMGSPQVLVAVIDGGIDITHPDLAGNIYTNPGEIPGDAVDNDGNGYIDDVNGWDVYYNDNTVYHSTENVDSGGHGTHVSGTIAALANNSKNIPGIAPNVKILPIKYLGGYHGTGNSADAVEAINYAKKMGAKVINASWGGGLYDTALRDAISNSGAVFVAAAGNNASNNDITPHYPSSYDCSNIISVAAIDYRGRLAGWSGMGTSTSSNYGLTSVDLGAPGDNINSLLPNNGSGSMSGTSMAAPHVSGIAALVLSTNLSLNNTQVKDIIMQSADPLDAMKGKTATGGMANAHKALLLAADKPVITGADPCNLGTKTQLDKTITLKFSENVSPDTGFNGISLSDGAAPVPTVNTVSNNTLTIDPVNNLDPNKTYTVTVPLGAVKDDVGNSLAAPLTYIFDTIDTIIPTLTYTSPKSGATGSLSQAVYFYFSENIYKGPNFNAISYKKKSTGTPIGSTYIVFGTDSNRLGLIPYPYPSTQNLEPLTTYIVTIPYDALTDKGGNYLDKTYTVEFNTNNGEPIILGSDPTEAAYAVPLDKTISFRIDKSVATGPNYANITLTSNSEILPVYKSISSDGTTLYLDPVSNLQSNKSYTVKIPFDALVTNDGKYLSADYYLNFSTYPSALKLWVDPTPEYTNVNNINITGSAEAGSTVTVNGEPVTLNGTSFSKNISLNPGSNSITVISTSTGGQVETITRVINYDNVAPNLTVTSPTEGQTTIENFINVSGTTELDTTVLINGKAVTPDYTGSFSQTVNLLPGLNNITVAATDRAGNVTVVTRMVVCQYNVVRTLSVTPNPIKLGSNATISYSLSNSAYLTMTVYDNSGIPIRTLLNNTYKATGSLTQAWDGKTDGGVMVPDGNYKISLEAKDVTGMVLGKMETTVQAARVPAISGANAIPNPFNPLLGETCDISYTLSSDALVTVQILKGTTSIRTIVSNQPQTAGLNTIAWDGRDNTGSIVGDGPYTYQINAVSPLIPTFKAVTIKGTINIEKEAPTVSNLTVSSNSYKIGSSLSIGYTLSESGKVTVKIVDESGSLIRTLVNNLARNAGTNTTIWDGKADNGIPVSDGLYTIIVSEIDNFGNNSAELSKTITAARVPAISGAMVAPSTFNPLLGEFADISYNLSTDALVTVQILKGTTSVRTIVSGQQQFAGLNTISWDGKDNAGNIAGDGLYTFQIDAVSNLVPTFKATPVKGTVYVEKEAPTVSNLTVSTDPYKLGTPLTIGYTLSENGKVTVTVLDETGTTVRTVANNLAKNAGYNTSSWDGKSDSGTLVAPGKYTIVVSETDNYFNVSNELTRTITAAVVPVISGASALPNPFNPNLGETADISYNLSTDALVTVQILKGTTSVRTIVSGQQQFAGLNTISWDGKDNAGNIAGDGLYTFQIDAVSSLVPTFKATALKGTVNLESVAPTVSNLTVSADPYKLGTNLTIRYTLSENGKVTVQVLDSNGSVIRTIANGLAKNAGANSSTWDGKNDSGEPVADGMYTIVINETDNYGNISNSLSRTITAANYPVISLASATPNPFNPAIGESATINYNLSCEAFVSYKILKGTAVIRNFLLPSVSFGPGAHCFDWDGKDNNGNVVGDGTYTYQIDAVNPLVGTFKTTYKGTVTVETGAPQITNVTVKDPYFLTSSLTIGFTLSENSKVTVVIWDNGGNLIRTVANALSKNAGVNSVIWDGKDVLGVPVPEGMYTIIITAIDIYNNTAETTKTITALTKSVLTVTSVTPNPFSPTMGQSVTVNYYVSVDFTPNYCIKDSSGNIIKSYAIPLIIKSPGSYSFTWDGTDMNGSIVAPGTYYYEVSVGLQVVKGSITVV